MTSSLTLLKEREKKHISTTLQSSCGSYISHISKDWSLPEQILKLNTRCESVTSILFPVSHWFLEFFLMGDGCNLEKNTTGGYSDQYYDWYEGGRPEGLCHVMALFAKQCSFLWFLSLILP